MKLTKALFILSSLLLIAGRAQAITPNVDLRDLVQHGSVADQQEAQALINQINQSPQQFGLPQGFSYQPSAQTAVGQTGVSTAEVQNQTPYGSDVYLIYTSGKQVVLTKSNVDMSGRITLVSSTDLTKNPPQVQIDILHRQLTLSEAKSGFLKFEPASMGSLVHQTMGDESSGFKSLSVPFARAVLSRSKSELSRTKPDYYGGRPFLRIVNLDQREYGGFTPFGVHYQISDVLQRGFISNGCFRLRDADLYELASIVFLSRKGGVPISVVNSTANTNRHPFPMIKSWFNMPRIGTDAKGKLGFLTDEHGLYSFEKTNGRPEDLLRQSGY